MRSGPRTQLSAFDLKQVVTNKYLPKGAEHSLEYKKRVVAELDRRIETEEMSDALFRAINDLINDLEDEIYGV